MGGVKMRNLQFQDLFKVMRILKKAELSRQARTIMLKAAEAEDPKQINVKDLGMDFLFSVLENMGEAEQEVYAFFADLTSKQPTDIKTMDFEEMEGMFRDFLDIPNLKSFFSKLSTMMK